MISRVAFDCNRYAFLLYPTDELASIASKEYETKKLMLDGQRLYVLKYRLPVENLPRGMMQLLLQLFSL